MHHVYHVYTKDVFSEGSPCSDLANGLEKLKLDHPDKSSVLRLAPDWAVKLISPSPSSS